MAGSPTGAAVTGCSVVAAAVGAAVSATGGGVVMTGAAVGAGVGEGVGAAVGAGVGLTQTLPALPEQYVPLQQVYAASIVPNLHVAPSRAHVHVGGTVGAAVGATVGAGVGAGVGAVQIPFTTSSLGVMQAL